jgi:hypothetical protein
MKRRVRLVTFLFSILALAFSSATWAAEPPPTTGTIVGPELWGVVVIDCGAESTATLRVKRVDDCDVQTQAVVVNWTSCPSSENDPLNKILTGVVLFDINPGANPVPIITKVKNWTVQGTIFSFDVQIKFWQP